MGYGPLGHNHDEMLFADGQIRPHWRDFTHGLDELGPEEFQNRWMESRQIIRENGITYNVYGDPRGLDRPWQLDPIPFIISPEEYEYLGKGLTQRACLLEAILADIYGPQLLLKNGWLPPEIVFANPGFLRPCHGISLSGRRHLHLTAFDVGRGADGNLWILGDRTQAPSGAGYALENRIVLSRMLPELFRQCKVERLAMFFRNLRDTVRALAPNNRDNPRTVLLSPGPYNETYFEHAYLARYLGFTLAEGGDLTVRDQHLYLKLLDGLVPVDVVWRRLDDDFCDPLELRPDSFLGIPGLVQAVRAGNVVVANPLGSGWAESPALIPYLPGLCQHLLGEPLRIPSVASYWCGDAPSLQHVLAKFDTMVIKGAFPTMRLEPVFPARLSSVDRQKLMDRVMANPHRFVGQEILNLSTTPTMTEKGLEPRHVLCRMYLGAHGTSFEMMPGGLTRITPSPETMVVSLQSGGGSKDTWVLSKGPVNEFTMLKPNARAMELSRAGNDIPSRAADNLFWLGRYVERAEGMVRLLRGVLVRLTEKSGLADVPELPTLLRAITHLTQTFPGFLGEGSESRLINPTAELMELVFQPDYVNGFAFLIRSIQRTASSVRDRISMDMWRILSHLPPEKPANTKGRTSLSELLDMLNHRVITLAGFGGITMESMTRGHGWRFLDMGRKIEGAFHMVKLVKSTLAQSVAGEVPLLESLLEIADCSMTYRRRYLGGVQMAPVLDLLLVDENNPRSLGFQLLALHDAIKRLPVDPNASGRSPEHSLVLAMLAQVQLADVENLAYVDAGGQRPCLKEFLDQIEKDIPSLSEAISHHYLSHLQTSRQLAGVPGGTA
ncbi:MAG: hypothetical protein RL595_3036 [Planctomycetota bacterium]